MPATVKNGKASKQAAKSTVEEMDIDDNHTILGGVCKLLYMPNYLLRCIAVVTILTRFIYPYYCFV